MSDTPTKSTCLTVALDIRQPAAYLALGPAAEFCTQAGIEVDWLPLVVAPLKPPSKPGETDDRGIEHRRHRANAIAREIAVYASAAGLVVRDYYRDPDPSLFNLAWLWMRERHRARLFEFLAGGFAPYWAGEFDPSDEAAVIDLLVASGADAAAFTAWCVEEGPCLAEEVAESLAERGALRAPSYLLGDEVFIGRQHLPMIAWIVGGRRGPGPI